MNPDTLIQRGNPGYSKQQKQLRDASRAQAAPVSPVTAPVVSPTAPISSATMTPVSPVTLPQPIQPTAAAGMSGVIEATNKSIAQQRAEAMTAQQENEVASRGTLNNQLLQEIMGVNTEVSQAAGTIDRSEQDRARREADSLTSQIEAEALATRRQIENLQRNNPQGLFGGALQDEIARIERDSASKQADLAILQNSALRNYETANSIADRQLQLKLEPLKLKAENLKLFYQDNKDRFNKADDRLFAEVTRKAEQEYKKAEAAETALSEAKITAIRSASEQGAPSSVVQAIQNAKTPAEAIIAAGKYGGDILAQAIKKQTLEKNNLQMNQIREEIRRSKIELQVPTVPGSALSTTQIMLNSAKNDKFADQKTKEQIAKSGLVIDQLSELQQSIAKQNMTGFVKGRTAKLMSALGQDANAGLVQAQLTAIVPQVARGVYGEVGVLTEADTVAYRNTLPNLTSSQQQNDLVMAMTLNVVGKGLRNVLETEANNGVNVSGNVAKYNEIMAKKSEIEDRIGVTKTRLFEFGAANPNYQPMIQEMLATGAKPSDVLTAIGAN